MKNTILRYGTYGAISITVLFFVALFLGQYLDYGAREVVGYTTMVLSLSFIFFGIKHYRDHENQGVVTFTKALGIGVLISLIVSLVFGVIDVIYIEYINPDFVAEYYANSIKELRNSVPAAELQEKLKALEAQKEMFSSSFMNFLLMSIMVFVLGFIISLISALFLQRK
ncbi:MAG: DUF4199 domain-containing protein [Flavobacteriaceae bacterium]|nr:DUF4199 domain-containing protein [Flavobacteriaceae bacterium]